MTESTAPGPRGIPTEALRLFGSLVRHLQSLLALADLEGREAMGVYLRVAIALGAALFCAAFGYVFVLLFVAFALDRMLGVDWIWISLGFAVLHLLGAVAGGLYVKKNFATPIFRSTAEEIRRDLAALRQDRSGTAPLM
ncbi:MAG: phage holin family protein [Terrimicrobiaceae bacterium]|nr:phage holin family protein [Terrimicrobiaceae bacterium]